MSEDGTRPYAMTISLNVLNHLGINLYSNVSAVLSEVVANAYDADAEVVKIDLQRTPPRIVVEDDGSGMDLEGINERFLTVGYRRRDSELKGYSEKRKRPVMGRKGIGKLSLFSISNVVEVYTTTDGVEKHAFRMDIEGIRAAIEGEGGVGTYEPEPISTDSIDFDHGTRIVLPALKKSMTNLETGLRKRLARRFSILGAEHGFQLEIGGREVTVADRDYFHKLQYAWAYEDEPAAGALLDQCTNADEKIVSGVGRAGDQNEFQVTGWIGTAFTSSSLKDEHNDKLNSITLMVRGKLAHEDLLEELNEGGVFRSYLIGEVSANFLDLDDEADIATSSRQKIIEEDPRYLALLAWLRKEITRIGTAWSRLRDQKGTTSARTNPLIDQWFTRLGPDHRKRAQRLFGKINQLTVDGERERNELFAHAVLAFETLRYRENLDALEDMSGEQVTGIAAIFNDIENLEAAQYHRIVVQRLTVIEKLKKLMDENALEKFIQDHLFQNLWLLDPSWERATDRAKEKRIGTTFAEIDEKLTDEERNSRFDIKYKRMSGSHVIVELKRPEVVTNSTELLGQIRKYINALRKFLRDTGVDEPVETVCVVGKDLRDWADPDGREESRQILGAVNARVVKYEELLDNAQNAYREFLDGAEELSQLRAILDSLAEESGQEVGLASEAPASGSATPDAATPDAGPEH
ncbi:ATP-binding protein [Actinomycetospora callitridis]|uniref:BbrUII/HgiDII family restriction enzyme n=1 Tax=Actinomycetospora callitridis TaxID=913944 RepID=UPI002365ED6C|nr:ATP-binding protein [Actinomycetospora callitridis]MDD7919681.1 ATP-binding protein [Actinomycetospora callitridis]